VNDLPAPSRRTRLPHRLMNGVLSLREIEDVEHHVASRFDGLPLAPLDRDSIVLHGIAYACRIDRALPPEQALGPVLDPVLDKHVAGIGAGHAAAA
jgi:hypothetical protein